MRLSVLVPFLPRRPEQILPWAELVRDGAAARLWQGQSLLVEPHQAFAFAAGAGVRVPTGLGVTLMPLRSPYEAALQARSLAGVTGRSVVAGFGPGAPSAQAGLRGRPYGSPLTAAREYLALVRDLLDGRTVDRAGRYFSCSAALPPWSGPAVEVGLGVLRPGMARLAGELADAAITWLTPARYLRDVLAPALADGAAAAARPAPRLVAIVPVGLAHPGHDGASLALSSNRAHLQGGHYRDMLRRSGLAIGADPAPADAAELVRGGAYLHGDTDVVTAALHEFRRAGADEVVLNLTGVFNTCGPRAALRDATTILAAADARAGRQPIGAG